MDVEKYMMNDVKMTMRERYSGSKDDDENKGKPAAGAGPFVRQSIQSSARRSTTTSSANAHLRGSLQLAVTAPGSQWDSGRR